MPQCTLWSTLFHMSFLRGWIQTVCDLTLVKIFFLRSLAHSLYSNLLLLLPFRYSSSFFLLLLTFLLYILLSNLLVIWLLLKLVPLHQGLALLFSLNKRFLSLIFCQCPFQCFKGNSLSLCALKLIFWVTLQTVLSGHSICIILTLKIVSCTQQMVPISYRFWVCFSG